MKYVGNEKQGLKSILKLESLQATNSLLISSSQRNQLTTVRVRLNLKIGERGIDFFCWPKYWFRNNLDVRGGSQGVVVQYAQTKVGSP